MTIKLITFDLDNTLWHTDPIIARAEQRLWDWMQVNTPLVAERFNPNSIQTLKSEIANKNPHLRHKLSQLRLEILYQLFTASDYSPIKAKCLAQEAFAEFLTARNDVQLFPGALEMLTSLKQNHTIIALTNGNADLNMIGIDHLFDAHFHAENVARPKPHDDMFIAAMKYAGVSAHECIHVGDHPEQDILAAQQLGFQTIWANILKDSWPKSLQIADHEIHHLGQLVDCI